MEREIQIMIDETPIFVIYRGSYKQFIRDQKINHVFIIDGGMLTLYDEVRAQ